MNSAVTIFSNHRSLNFLLGEAGRASSRLRQIGQFVTILPVITDFSIGSPGPVSAISVPANRGLCGKVPL